MGGGGVGKPKVYVTWIIYGWTIWKNAINKGEWLLMNPLNKTNSSINGESFGHLSNQSGPKKEEHVCMNVERSRK